MVEPTDATRHDSTKAYRIRRMIVVRRPRPVDRGSPVSLSRVVSIGEGVVSIGEGVVSIGEGVVPIVPSRFVVDQPASNDWESRRSSINHPEARLPNEGHNDSGPKDWCIATPNTVSVGCRRAQRRLRGRLLGVFGLVERHVWADSNTYGGTRRRAARG
jgi:hypothetical protein